MLSRLAGLKQRPLGIRALIMLGYGVISFVLLYWLGAQLLDNILLELLLEGIWFFHILFVVNIVSDGSAEFFTLAICGLMPGLLKNVLALGSV